MPSAIQAANQILRFSDTIPAMDQEAFVAGFVELLSIYPPAVIERAMKPSIGLPAMVAYPNLAKYREHLEIWAKEYWTDRARDERLNRKQLPEPPRDPEAEARIAQGLRDLVQHLKSGFSPGSV